jgi:agmatine deiminase
MIRRVVPGEWEQHRLTLVSWPTRREVWSGIFDKAWDEYLALVHGLSKDEKVVVICRKNDREQVAARCPSGTKILVHPIDDGWIRDNGPLAVRTADGLIAVDFDFNSWGRRFAPWDGDASVGKSISELLEVRREAVPFVLEGGAISFNGGGTALVVEECVLHPNRNGSIARRDFEDVVSKHLGVEKVIWLPYGLLEDLENTDGHVDNVAIFVADDAVLTQMAPAGNPNHGRLKKNFEVLKSSRNARGRRLEVEVIDQLPYTRTPSGRMQPVSYMNLVHTNRGIVLPSVGAMSDRYLIKLAEGLWPDRNVSMVPAYALTHGGGGPHCVTMQWPME